MAAFPCRVACGFCLTRDLFGHAPRGAACHLASAADGPARLMTYVLHRVPGTSAHVLNGPPGSLTDTLRDGAGAPAHILDGRAGTLPHVLYGSSGALTDVPDGGSRTLPDLLDGPSGTRTHLPHGLTGSAADILHGGPDSTRQLVQDLRVAVERGEHSVDDLCDVMETYLELGLGLNARDAEMHPPERDVGAHIQFQQIQHLRLQRDMRPQVLDVQVDLVDLQDRNIEENVRARIRCALLVVSLRIGVLATVLSVEFVTVLVVIFLNGALTVLGVAAHRHASAVLTYFSTILFHYVNMRSQYSPSRRE
ncbi:hypothetical protein [Streptomyces sp. NPDC056464]|uniref:hypothetical protein n=1 Tax=Streptomyces sp. NPDC056464 TaxID=3345828 RepID=UPI00369B199D